MDEPTSAGDGDLGGDSEEDTQRHPDFTQILDQFHGTVDAVREMANSLKPHVEALDNARIHEWATTLETIGVDRTNRLRALLLLLLLFSPSGAKKYEDSKEFQTVQEFVDKLHGEARDGSLTLSTTTLSPLLGDSTVAFLTSLDRLLAAIKAPVKSLLLNASLLTLLVGGLEVLIGGLMTQHFLRHDGDIDATEKEFSLADLRRFASVRDAEDTAIHRRVEALLWKSFDDWATWFQKRLGVGFDELSDDLDALREVIQRRHAIVHNAGRASALYLAKTGVDRQVGDQLSVTSAYLQSAIDRIEILGTLLALKCWWKWASDERAAIDRHLNQRIYTHMKQDRWAVVEIVTRVGQTMAVDQATRTVMQINEFLAVKRLRGSSEARARAAAIDVSALSDRYRFGYACLVDDLDEALRLAPHIIEEEGEAPILDWPLSEELRQDTRARGLPVKWPDDDRIVLRVEDTAVGLSNGAETSEVRGREPSDGPGEPS